jgi:hypothetical protein
LKKDKESLSKEVGNMMEELRVKELIDVELKKAKN